MDITSWIEAKSIVGQDEQNLKKGVLMWRYK